MKLEAYYIMKPHIVTQAWGIFNPAYEQFGYSKHNGEDNAIGSDKKLWWPVHNCTVYYSDYGEYTGWCIKANTNDFFDFEDGKKARVNIIMMHLDHQSPLKVGQVVDVGDFAGVPDNTGFSTGPHTHLMFRRIDKDGNLIDKNDADNSIDPKLYHTGYYAQDYDTLLEKFQSLILILQRLVGTLPTNNK